MYLRNDEIEILDIKENGKYIAYGISRDRCILRSIRVVDTKKGTDCLLCANCGTLGISAYVNRDYKENDVYSDILIKSDRTISYDGRRIRLYVSNVNNINVLVSMWLGESYNILEYFDTSRKGLTFFLSNRDEYEYSYESYRDVIRNILIAQNIKVNKKEVR